MFRTVPKPAVFLPPTKALANNIVNLQQRKLLHHFQSSTRQTLVFTSTMWDHMLQLAHNFDFLMDAILCITARHLAFLCPKDCTYSSVASSHLCRALSGLRVELSNDLTSSHLDVFVATSMLIQFELWTNTDHVLMGEHETSSIDTSKDQLFTFASSLKQVFLNRFPLSAIRASTFMPHVRCNPMEALVAAACISKEMLTRFHQFFSYDQQLGLEHFNLPGPFERDSDQEYNEMWNHHSPTRENEINIFDNGYRPVVTKLCLITSFLPEARPLDILSQDVMHELQPTMARFLMLFPIMCHGPFAVMMLQEDPHALFLLYHFYRSVRLLISPERYWWAQKRASISEKALKIWLERRVTSVDAKLGGITQIQEINSTEERYDSLL